MGSILGGFTPIKKLFFPAIGSSLSFTKIAAHAVLSNSRVAFDHRSFTKIAAHADLHPPYRGSPPPTQQMNIRNKNQLGWATN